MTEVNKTAEVNKTTVSTWLIVFLGALTAIAPFSTDMYLPALPAMSREFSASTSMIQLTLTASMLGMAIGQIFAGPISDIKGRRRPLFVGMGLFTLSSIACVLAGSIYIFLAFRFIQGLSGAAGIVIARAVARDLYKGSLLTKFFSLLMLVNGIAPILSPVVGAQILVVAPWQGIFIFLTLIGGLLATAAFLMKESLSPEKRMRGGLRSSLRGFANLLGNRYFLGHCLMQCTTFAAFFAYIAGSSFVFQNVYGVSAQGFSGIFALNGVGLMIGGFIVGRMVGRIPDVTMLKWGILQAVVGSFFLLGAFVLQLSLPLVIIILFFTVSTLSIVGTSSFSLAMQAQGRMAGSASALIGFFSTVSGGIMAPLVGLAGSHNALPMGIIMVLGEVGAAIFFYWLIQPAHKSTVTGE